MCMCAYRAVEEDKKDAMEGMAARQKAEKQVFASLLDCTQDRGDISLL